MTARAWSPDAPYDSLNSTFLPGSDVLKSATRSLLAVFRMEKPTTLTFSPLPLSPEAGSEHADVANRDAASMAAPSSLTGDLLVIGNGPFVRVGNTRGVLLQ